MNDSDIHNHLTDWNIKMATYGNIFGYLKGHIHGRYITEECPAKYSTLSPENHIFRVRRAPQSAPGKMSLDSI